MADTLSISTFNEEILGGKHENKNRRMLNEPTRTVARACNINC